MERRLAAILAADVVGYTRLMGADEAGTLRRLTDLREKVLEPLITEHHGRIVKLMGDGLLVEFASAVDSVACAKTWQDNVAQHEADNDAAVALQFRIGINLGDVIAEGGDIHGDGVNIAARLEGLAQPGGICLSDDVYRHAKGKIEAQFEDIGEQKLKNVADPIRVYRVALELSAAEVPASADALPLPDKPSIAVLPFDNMSGDPEQEYFSDGITEDIITELSRFPELFVIARTSTFTFKNQALDVRQVAGNLGVRFVLEGSVRKIGTRVRINAQLIDATTGTHVWADRYDRDLEDIFEVQDEIVSTIVAVLPGRIAHTDVERSRHKPSSNLTAYDYLMRGKHALPRRGQSSASAIAMFEKAIELDPDCAAAYAGIAVAEGFRIWDASKLDTDPITRAYDCAKKAVAIDDNNYRSHGVLGMIHVYGGEHALARRHLEHAMTLNPNDAELIGYWAMMLAYSGEHEVAVEAYHRAVRLDPYNRETIYSEALAESYYMMKRYKEAIGVLETMLQLPIYYAHQQIAMCYAQLGDTANFELNKKLYYERLPDDYDEVQLFQSHMRMFARKEDREHWREGYRKVGLDV